MSWRENKKRGGGYSRGSGRGYRQNRGGGNSRYGTSENSSEDAPQRQHSGYRSGGYRSRPYKRTQANHAYDGKRVKYEIGKRLKEDDIGVTEFIGSHKRFGGIIKERFGDFNVHEISCDGEICKLTNQDIPPEPQDLEDMEKLKSSVPSEIREKIESFTTIEDDAAIVEIDVTDMDKETRRNIHVIAKKIPSVNSETVERDDKKIIVLAKRNKQIRHKFRSDPRVDWSSRDGNYCHFLLHKVNLDTMEALNQMAIKLRIKSDIFHYAGTKDRRARTTQWISLKKISPTNIHDAAKQVRGAHVGNFKFSKDPLRLGMLAGNRFRIALRSVDGTDEEIETAVKSLRDNGFINYYGLQRFGTIAAIPTHEIGKALLRGRWNEAIDLILKPRIGEQHSDMIAAREIYEKTKNATAALRPIARTGKIEAKLLRGIVNSGDSNPQGALDFIPRNARLMYIHAYQSFVWNNIVSKRIREFGAKPIVGDLVYVTPESKDLSETMDYRIQQDDEKDAKFVKDERTKIQESSEDIEKTTIEIKESDKTEESTTKIVESEKSKVKDSKMEVEEREKTPEIVEDKIDQQTEVTTDKISEMTVSKDPKTETKNDNDDTIDDTKDLSSLPAVKALTEDDLENYSLADVVMPKPGWRVVYPSYAKPWFDEFLAKDDLTTDLRQKNKKYSLGGAYRKILETPGELSWKIVRYNGYHDDLILCDIDEMRGVETPKEEPEGKHKALILEFSLKSSTYATMALREILEHDTSAYTQAAQSAANQAQDSQEEAKKMEKNGEPDEEEATVEVDIGKTIEEITNDEKIESVENKKENSGSKDEKMEVKTSEMEIAEDSANIPEKKNEEAQNMKL